MVQDGARLHYAVPLALQRAGVLQAMFTDWFLSDRRLEQRIGEWCRWVYPGWGNKLADRSCAELRVQRVNRNPWLLLSKSVARFSHRSAEEHFAWLSALHARWIVHRGLGPANAVFGFIRNIHPRLLAACRARGLTTVADQMSAPAAVQREELARQIKRWPDWQSGTHAIDFDTAAEFECRTWERLDHVTCASEYVRAGLIAQGVKPVNISVLPYPIDMEPIPTIVRPAQRHPVTVGFLGRVELWKGAPYFREVASRVNLPGVRFVMIGPVHVPPAVQARLKDRVELVGPVPRSEVMRRLAQFDIFFFPSTCEGSAGAVMEAMASGLPVVTTPNSGTLVRDGIEGFVRAADDTAGLADAVHRLVDDPALRRAMGDAARHRASAQDIQGYGRELVALFQRLLEGKR
ncbi:hypothetical protein AYO44_05310 [Planctomycetaceae bacterium SCGC AG-212-F19]|nr:hypothetical protein AYO44_05310 [Planctomycetaceae bacterium SCGC AG-212-F19]